LRAAAVAVALTLAFGVAPMAGVSSDEAAEIGAQILESYDVRRVDGTIRLYPHDAASAVRSIEVTDDGEVMVNGKEFDNDELLAFLGAEGELILALVELDSEDRRAALEIDGDAVEDTGRRGRRDRRSEGVSIQVPVGVPGTHFNVHVSGDDRVSVGRSIHIGENETAREVVCIGCAIDVEGETSSDVVAIGGSVRVTGTIGGSATAVGGSVHVRDGAVVEGDAVAVGGSVQTEGDGQVLGQNTTVGLGGPWLHGWSWGSGWAFPWGAFSDTGRLLTSVMRTGLLALLAVLGVLMLGPAVDRMAQRAGEETWKAAFAGLLMQLLFLPAVRLEFVRQCRGRRDRRRRPDTGHHPLPAAGLAARRLAGDARLLARRIRVLSQVRCVDDRSRSRDAGCSLRRLAPSPCRGGRAASAPARRGGRRPAGRSGGGRTAGSGARIRCRRGRLRRSGNRSGPQRRPEALTESRSRRDGRSPGGGRPSFSFGGRPKRAAG
jgi:hypothetical protein